jgi:hypothetical protein
MKKILNKLIRNESGQVMPIVLILLLISGLMMSPLMGLMSTGLKAGQANEERMTLLYAADAGIEQALSQMQYNPAVLPGYGDPPLVYNLVSDLGLEPVNGKEVTVEIAYTWLLEGLESDANGTMPHIELVAIDRTEPATGEYEVEITYDGTNGNVWIDRIGVWLPGMPVNFSYIGPTWWDFTTSDPDHQVGVASGTALIWDLSPRVKLPVDALTTNYHYFNFEPIGEVPKGSFTWVRSDRMDIYLAWSGSIEKYRITSTVTDAATGKQTVILANTFLDTDVDSVGITTWEVNLQ